MRQRPSSLSLVLLVAGCLIGLTDAGHAGDVRPDRSMRMYRDPETGAVGPPSAAALRAEAAAPSAAAALPQAAVEEPVRAAAGGVKINLRGGHRPAVVRHADPGAPALHECVDAAGAAHE